MVESKWYVMNLSDKNVLLISYTFPPYPGIGGRRWAKTAKYLTRLGYTVHVIHAKNQFKENSLWLNDIENNDHIIRHEIYSGYPSVLLTQPKSSIEKIKYRLSLYYVNFFSKGTPYDRGIFWGKSMMQLSEKLIKQYNIKNVIVSSAPFSDAYNAIELKSKTKDLNLMIDFRDPWTWGKGYGMTTLKTEKISFEKEMELKVMQKFDKVFVPSQDMNDHLALSYKQFSDKLIVLPHAFDKDEIVVKPKQLSDTTRLLFYGSLYSNLDYVFKSLAIFIGESSNKISLEIYSSSRTYIEKFDSKHLIGKTVNYYPQILPDELFSKMDCFDYVIIVQPDYAKDFITTKIYEVIYAGKPILLISNKGKLFDFIKKNNLGLCFSKDDLPNKLKTIFEFNSNDFNVKGFPINEYSFETIVSSLSNFLK